MRLEITRKADLAVRAMAALTAAGGRLKGNELAAGLDTTPGFLPQVIGPLVKAGWVRSDPGPAGGYRATDAAAALSVLQIIEAIDGPTDTGRCVVADGPCDARHPCALHEAWAGARSALLATLDATPLAALASQPARRATRGGAVGAAR
jgi:Rrf2 family protein